MDYQALRDCVIDGDAMGAEAALSLLLDDGADANDVVAQGLIPAMDVVGRNFSSGEFFVPEMLTAARAMKQCMTVLEPHLVGTERTVVGTVVLGTVKGDVHDIGKNIVATMLRGVGFEVLDLGVDVPTDGFVEAVREHRPDILALSALLTTTMPRMKDVITALEQGGLRKGVIVLVGGAPLTAEYALSIGADGYAAHAGNASERAKELVEATKSTTGEVR